MKKIFGLSILPPGRLGRIIKTYRYAIKAPETPVKGLL